MNKDIEYKPILLFAATIVLVALGATDCLAAEVTLRARASVFGGLVRLGDVADIAARDEATVDRLRNLPLMPAPAPGTQTVVTAGGVRDLVTASGEDLETLRFSGAIRVTIGDAAAEPVEPRRRTFVDPTPDADRAASPQREERPRQQTGFVRSRPPVAKRQDSGTRRAPRTNLSRSATEQIKTTLGQRLSEFAQQQTGDPMMQALAPEVDASRLARLSRATSPVEVATTTAVGAGRQRFLVSFQTAEGHNRFPVFANVQPARPAVFATRSVPRGATITRADVEVRPLPIDARLRPNAAPFGSIDEVVGKEAASPLRPGVVLDERNCLPPLMVRRGSEVSVIAGGGGIRVRLQAKARSDGRLGEIVPVETYDSRERLMARVVAGGEVAVLSTARSTYTASLPRNLR